MVVLRVSKLSILGNKKLRVSKLSLSGTNTNPKLRISKLSLSGAAPVAVQPIADQLYDAFASASVVVVPSPSSPPPTAYIWRQISGPATSFVDNGTSITFSAPPAWAGTTVVFGVTAYYNSSPSSEVTATVNVNPHLYWRADVSGVWIPRRVPIGL